MLRKCDILLSLLQSVPEESSEEGGGGPGGGGGMGDTRFLFLELNGGIFFLVNA
jgi:hypothetical protein